MIKDAFLLYRYNFWRIVIIGITIVLPIQFLFNFFVNYISFPFQTFGIPLWTNLFQIFFMLISLCLIQVPFISIITQENRFDEVRMKKVYGDSLTYMFPIYLTSILYAALAVLGTVFLVIPGLIVMILFLGLSQAAIIEEQQGIDGMKRALIFGKERFFHIFCLILAFAFIDFFISGFAYTVVAEITNSIFIANITIMVINMFILPLFIFMTTLMYVNWKDKRSKLIEEEKAHPFRQKYV